jgi:hypothetical protein
MIEALLIFAVTLMGIAFVYAMRQRPPEPDAEPDHETTIETRRRMNDA